MSDQTTGPRGPTGGKNSSDLPREEAMARASTLLRDKASEIYFKYTCEHCGERNTFNDPNTLWSEGECYSCGKISKVDRAGFMVVLDMKEARKRKRGI